MYSYVRQRFLRAELSTHSWKKLVYFRHKVKYLMEVPHLESENFEEGSKFLGLLQTIKFGLEKELIITFYHKKMTENLYQINLDCI